MKIIAISHPIPTKYAKRIYQNEKLFLLENHI